MKFGSYLLATTICAMGLGHVSASTAGAAPSSVAPTPRRQVSFDFLMEACADIGDPASARGAVPFFDCHSYIYGVMDAYVLARTSIPKSDRACFPANLAPWKVMLELWPLLKTTKFGPEPAAPIIIATLRKKYPCT
jgi:hypothetical protein